MTEYLEGGGSSRRGAKSEEKTFSPQVGSMMRKKGTCKLKSEVEVQISPCETRTLSVLASVLASHFLSF